MTQRVPTFFPDRLSVFVRNLQYISDLPWDGISYRVDFGAVATAAALANTIAITGAALTFQSITGYPYTLPEAYGRAVKAVAGAANASVIKIHGRDYLGQRMTEAITLNGTTPVLGKKAFKYIDTFSWDGTASGTVTLTTLDVLGLPYAAAGLQTALKDNKIPASNPLTVVQIDSTATQTATTGDPRGTVTLSGSDAADGTKTFQAVIVAYHSSTIGLHGVAQFYS